MRSFFRSFRFHVNWMFCTAWTQMKRERCLSSEWQSAADTQTSAKSHVKRMQSFIVTLNRSLPKWNGSLLGLSYVSIGRTRRAFWRHRSPQTPGSRPPSITDEPATERTQHFLEISSCRNVLEFIHNVPCNVFLRNKWKRKKKCPVSDIKESGEKHPGPPFDQDLNQPVMGLSSSDNTSTDGWNHHH